MIGNGYPHGERGFVILEEGDIDPTTLQLKIRHYLVIQPNGEQVSGTFSLREAKAYIDATELKLKKNNNLGL